MTAEAMVTTLKSLKLFGMAETVAIMSEQAAPLYQQAVPILETLLKAEVAEREVRSINYQMGIAKLPLAKQLKDLDFEGTPINETM